MKPNDDSSSFASMFEAAPKAGAPRRFRIGDVLDLEVVRITATEVLVALDGKQEGYIALAELTNAEGKPTVSLGSRIAARVVEIERGTGAVRLSPVSTAPIVTALADGPAAAASGPAAAAEEPPGESALGCASPFPATSEEPAARGEGPG